MKKKFIFGLLLLSLGVYCAQSFVVPKQEKAKKESRSQLKERVCQMLYDVLHQFCDIGSSVSTVQRAVLQAVSEFVGGEKSSVIDSATDQQLKDIAHELEEVVLAIKSLEAKLLLLSTHLVKNKSRALE